jgi:hypothetical protein
MRWIETPHVPHGWEAGLFFEETGSTLFCGDLLTHAGDSAPVTGQDVAGAAIQAEQIFRAMSLAPATAETVRRLAALSPRTLALMHGASFSGDGAAQLAALAAWCENAALPAA